PLGLALEHAEAQGAYANGARDLVDVLEARVLLLHHGAGPARGLDRHLVYRQGDALAPTHRAAFEGDDLVRQVVRVLVRLLRPRVVSQRQGRLDDRLRM